jgi:hypothetical protein
MPQNISPNIHELTLLALLSRIKRTELEERMIHRRMGRIENWHRFYELAQLNRYAAFVYKNLKAMGLEHHVADDVSELFEKNIKNIETVNQNRLDEAKVFLKEFSERGIEVVILKGIYFAETFYNDPYYKRMNDFDILIHKKDLPEVLKVFSELGYFSTGELLGKSAQEHDQFSHHLPLFLSKSLNLMIRTHWELHTPMKSYHLDYKSLWERVVEFNFYGLDIKALSAEDNLHHLCVHLSIFEAGAREVGDIINLIRAFRDKFNWDIFCIEVDKAGSHNRVFLALSLAQMLDPISEFGFVLEYVRQKVSKKTLRHVARKQRSLKILLTTRSAHITKIDKAFTSFKSTKKASEKLYFYCQMWGNVLFPPVSEVIKLTDLDNPTKIQVLIGRVKAPISMMSYLCEDFGPKGFFQLLIYTFYRTISTIVSAPFKSGPENQEEFARKLGIKLEDIEKLKERLE